MELNQFILAADSRRKDSLISFFQILPKKMSPSSADPGLSLLGNFDLAFVDLVDDVMRRLAVDGAADGLRGAEDLLDGTFQLPRHGTLPHDAGDVDDLVEGDVAAVLDVLDLLAVTWGLLEGADEQSGGAGDNAHSCLTILDGQFDRDAETFPVLSGFGDVVTDLFRGKTERSNLGSEGGGGTNFTTDRTQADDLDFSGIELGRHLVGF